MAEEFGSYRLHRTINVGSIGEVFLAERIGDTEAGRPRTPVVIKRLHPQLARNPDQVELFREEGRLAQHFQHDHLVHAFDAGEVGREHYIAMELVRGPNLLQLGQMGPVDLGKTIAIIADVARGLGHVHAAGLVHCDLSPTNILVGPERTQLTDFGVANPAGRSQAEVRGSFGYMSPEQARGELLDERSDIFALGIVLWELLAGRALFHRRERYLTLAAVVEDEAPSLARPELAAYEAVARRALAKAPRDRFASCDELSAALRALRDQS